MDWTVIKVLLVAAVVAAGSSLARAETGEAIYKAQCQRCHGAAGQGTKKYSEPLIGEKSPAQLAALIARTMPDDDDEKCPPTDAKMVAAYMYDAFYSPDARARLDPPRVQLAHLTVRQYRNAVADVIGSFRGDSKADDTHGLRAGNISRGAISTGGGCLPSGSIRR